MGIKENISSIWKTFFISTSIQPLRFVLLLENVLAVYRNLELYNKTIRYLIYLRIILVIGMTFACLVSHAILDVPLSPSSRVIFYMNGITSIVIMTFASFYSKKFSKLVSLIDDNHKYFASDKEYHKSLLKQDMIIKYVFFISNGVSLILYIYLYMTLYFDIASNVNIFFAICGRIYDYRCITELMFVYALLYVISAQVECVTRALSRKTVPGFNLIENKEMPLDLTELEEMFTICSNIKKCSQLINEIFGRQLVLMLASATSYCILFLYNTASLSVNGFHDLTGFTGSVLKLITFFLPIFFLSWSAQKILNNVNNLRCKLGKLLIDCETNDAYYKATKGLLRLMTTCAIRTRTFGSIDVDMSLIPSFIMFVTSYTVIALQFNNVV